MKLEDIDFEFLTLIYDIVRSIDKEINELGSGQKIRESSDIHVKIQLLKDKFQKCREQIQKVEGINQTKKEQIVEYEALSKQLVQKRDLLQKYKHFSPSEVK